MIGKVVKIFIPKEYNNGRKGENVVGVVHATGTGKTYIALGLLLKHKNVKNYT